MISVFLAILVLLLIIAGSFLVWRSKMNEKEKSQHILLLIILLVLLMLVSELKHFNYLTFSLISTSKTQTLFHNYLPLETAIQDKYYENILKNNFNGQLPHQLPYPIFELIITQEQIHFDLYCYNYPSSSRPILCRSLDNIIISEQSLSTLFQIHSLEMFSQTIADFNMKSYRPIIVILNYSKSNDPHNIMISYFDSLHQHFDISILLITNKNEENAYISSLNVRKYQPPNMEHYLQQTSYQLNKKILRDKDQFDQNNLSLLNNHFGLSYELFEDYVENIEKDGNIQGTLLNYLNFKAYIEKKKLQRKRSNKLKQFMGEQKVISYSLIKQKFKSREDQKIIKTAELENRIQIENGLLKVLDIDF